MNAKGPEEELAARLKELIAEMLGGAFGPATSAKDDPTRRLLTRETPPPVAWRNPKCEMPWELSGVVSVMEGSLSSVGSIQSVESPVVRSMRVTTV